MGWLGQLSIQLYLTASVQRGGNADEILKFNRSVQHHRFKLKKKKTPMRVSSLLLKKKSQHFIFPNLQVWLSAICDVTKGPCLLKLPCGVLFPQMLFSVEGCKHRAKCSAWWRWVLFSAEIPEWKRIIRSWSSRQVIFDLLKVVDDSHP